jgi:hypothetical protein
MPAVALIVEKSGLADNADLDDGARAIERGLPLPTGSVRLRHAPLRTGDGFPKMRPGREYALEKSTRAMRLIFSDSDRDVRHVVTRRICLSTRLIVPVPSRRSSGRVADLVLLLDCGSPPHRIDQELAELFQILLPWRTSDAKFYRALKFPVRTLPARSTGESLIA